MPQNQRSEHYFPILFDFDGVRKTEITSMYLFFFYVLYHTRPLPSEWSCFMLLLGVAIMRLIERCGVICGDGRMEWTVRNLFGSDPLRLRASRCSTTANSFICGS